MCEQIYPDITSGTAKSFTCCGPVHTAFSCTSFDRPYPLPVQWLHVRYSNPISGLLSKTANYAIGSCPVRGPSLSQAHLSLPCASLLRLSAERFLPGQDFYTPDSMAQLRAIGRQHSPSIRSGLRSFCVLGSDRSIALTPFPVLARLVSRLLGA